MYIVFVHSIILIFTSEHLVCMCRFIMIIPLSCDVTDRHGTSLLSSWTSHAGGVCRKIWRSLLGAGESLLPWNTLTWILSAYVSQRNAFTHLLIFGFFTCIFTLCLHTLGNFICTSMWFRKKAIVYILLYVYTDNVCCIAFFQFSKALPPLRS